MPRGFKAPWTLPLAPALIPAFPPSLIPYPAGDRASWGILRRFIRPPGKKTPSPEPQGVPTQEAWAPATHSPPVGREGADYT